MPENKTEGTQNTKITITARAAANTNNDIQTKRIRSVCTMNGWNIFVICGEQWVINLKI